MKIVSGDVAPLIPMWFWSNNHRRKVQGNESEGQGAELLAETFPAGVTFPPGAVAVPAPVPDGTGNTGEFVVIRGHAAPLSQGDVMGGVERESSQVTKCSGISGGEMRAWS